MTRPVIGVSTCMKDVVGEEIPFHSAQDNYLVAVTEGSGGLPLLIPALGPALDPDELLGHLDGVLLTGSKSNVHPVHYGSGHSRPGTLHDHGRDATTVPLIRACVARGVPILAICRGIQELNVALGGTLHQHVHEIPGRMDHRPDNGQPLEAQFGPAHPVRLTPGGLLARLVGGGAEAMVNSLHSQGIDRLASGLVVEAVAPDGQIEAVRTERPSFCVGVQWHPEWSWREDLLGYALFQAFGDACRIRARTGRAAA